MVPVQKVKQTIERAYEKYELAVVKTYKKETIKIYLNR